MEIDREQRSRIIATVARWCGDLALAEEMTHEAVVQALKTWPDSGVPTSPEAWLKTVARRKLIDHVRREQVLSHKLQSLAIEEPGEPYRSELADFDDRLALFFACAHPALRNDDQIALTLRFLGGLTTAEVARALLVPVSTMQQRLVRAKQRIRKLGITFEEPAANEVRERLAVVQRVVYLVYAEGFARSSGTEHTQDDLTSEALRLVRLLRRLDPSSAETTGLLALLLLTEARRPTRTNADGRPVPLADQDRQWWDRDLITEGLALAESAAGAPGARTYAIQAAIAAVHAEAPTFADTDWPQIAVLYQLLEEYEAGPLVKLGRAIALGRVHGPRTGLNLIDELGNDPALTSLRAYHVARAVTLEELHETQAAIRAYRRALEQPGNEAEDAFLVDTLTGLA